MAVKSGKGLSGKLLVLLGLILIIFCTVYIVIDIVNKGDASGQIEQIGTISQQNKTDAQKALQEVQDLKRKVSDQITHLERQSQKLERAIAQMSFEIKDTGIKWHKNPATGSMYCLTPYPLPWHHAQSWAKEQGGNLVMINDKQENEWIVKTFGGTTQYWIGLTDEASEGKWFWTIGAPAQFFNWYQGEPDNYKDQQHYGIINNIEPGKWNDVAANEPRLGIVEKK